MVNIPYSNDIKDQILKNLDGLRDKYIGADDAKATTIQEAIETVMETYRAPLRDINDVSTKYFILRHTTNHFHGVIVRLDLINAGAKPNTAFIGSRNGYDTWAEACAIRDVYHDAVAQVDPHKRTVWILTQRIDNDDNDPLIVAAFPLKPTADQVLAEVKKYYQDSYADFRQEVPYYLEHGWDLVAVPMDPASEDLIEDIDI